MSEVVIVLNLKRRSGVLAAAVAAVHRAGLEFQSQRMVDDEGSPRLVLNATGEPRDADEIVDVFSRVGGVAEVADVLVDGQSLMHGLPEPEPEVAPESEPAAEKEPEPDPEPDPEPEPEPEPVREPEPEPTPIEEPDPEPTPKKASDDSEARRAEPVARATEAAGESSVELKPSMVRRRRRRR